MTRQRCSNVGYHRARVSRSQRTAVRLVEASGNTAARSLQQIARDYFLLGQNAAGRWVLRDNRSRKGGIFLSQKAAMQYARRESSSQQFAIVYLPEGLEFELG